MKFSIFAVASTAIASIASAISLGPRSAKPRTISLDIARSNTPRNLEADRNRLKRRQKTVSEILDDESTLYFADVKLGTPVQSLRLHIDTGSSDLWTNTANSSFCESAQNACQGGTYDPSSSSTYKFVNSLFNISYVDGSGSLGDYVSDTLTIGGQTLTDFQFGVGFTSSSQEGVLGIGYALNEVQVNRAGLHSYPNLPAALVGAGLINTNAYSLWLNDLDASTGSILFGGVNTAKYNGDLATIPIIPAYGYFVEFTIALSGLSVAGNTSTSSTLPAAVLLDSGSTLIYLPHDLATEIYDQVHAVYDSNGGVAYVECDLKNQDSNIDFTFSGQTINVPYNELVLSQAYSTTGQPLIFQNGAAACAFGIAPALGSTPVLGDTFLRSAYVVYDLQNNEISLAQTNFNATGNNDVREITQNNVPGATAVVSPVTTLAAGTGGGRLGGPAITVGSNPTGLTSGSILSKEVSGVLAALVVVGVAFGTL